MTRTVIDRIYGAIMNFFISDHPKWDPDGVDFDPNKVVCTVDDEEVDCFEDSLEARGFVFDEDKDRWFRIWSTKTPTGEEICLEVYKQVDGEWKSMMFGNDGDLFYEEDVNGTK